MPAVLPPLTELLDLMPDALCVVDGEGVLLYASAAFERMLGYPRDAVLGRRVFELVHPADRDATREQAGRLMQGTGERHFRNRYLHRDGHAVDLLWSAQWLPQYGVRVAVAREVGELRRVEQELERRAHHDALTGLVNRHRILELLDHAVADATRNGSPLALLYLDLDGFKAINDVHGHEVGDRVLVDVARRLKAGLRQDDTVARIGGDEFVAILPGCDARSARALVEAVTAQMAAPLSLRDGALSLRASVGVAAFPAHAACAQDLLRHADAAMYTAKRARKAPAVCPERP